MSNTGNRPIGHGLGRSNGLGRVEWPGDVSTAARFSGATASSAKPCGSASRTCREPRRWPCVDKVPNEPGGSRQLLGGTAGDRERSPRVKCTGLAPSWHRVKLRVGSGSSESWAAQPRGPDEPSSCAQLVCPSAERRLASQLLSSVRWVLALARAPLAGSLQWGCCRWRRAAGNCGSGGHDGSGVGAAAWLSGLLRGQYGSVWMDVSSSACVERQRHQRRRPGWTGLYGRRSCHG